MLPTRQPFVPDDFQVPAGLETPEFRLRMLTVHDLIRDFDAVMSSVLHLKFVWPHANWPESLTLEQNLVDLGWHQKEFQNRSSFAYAVMDLADNRELGCVYVNPSKKRGYDAVIYLCFQAEKVR